MKNLMIISMLLIVLSCNKTTTNNYILDSRPAYIVSGISDITLINGSVTSAGIFVTITYEDSAQQMITLGLNGLPAGIVLDSSYWIGSGLPTFTTTINILDTTSNGATPGTYPITFTTTTQDGKTKSYIFNLKIKAAVACTSTITGSYLNCSSCSSGGTYPDSVYADPTVFNKIWFTNFDKSGNSVYGILNCSSNTINIPNQTVGSYNYYGSGSFSGHYINLGVYVNGNYCALHDN